MSDLRHWLYANSPDLRITKELVGDVRVCSASFTYAGTFYELGPVGLETDDPDGDILRLTADTLCLAMGIPSLFAKQESSSLQAEIIRASLAGDDTAVKALTTEYVTRTNKTMSVPRRPAKGWTT